MELIPAFGKGAEPGDLSFKKFEFTKLDISQF